MTTPAPAPPMPDHSIEPVGERCLLIRLGEQVSVQTSRLVHAVTALLLKRALPGVMDVVPAFTSVAVYFDPMQFSPRRGLPSAQLTAAIAETLAGGVPEQSTRGRLVVVPACYGGEFGPDLNEVAQTCGLEPEEVIALHSGVPLTVYAFFFSPGNSFAGPVDPRLQVPRRRSPRTRVEAGTVAIANGITSIYQATSPGGWNLLARTPWNMFDVDATPPTRLEPGDRMQFRPIGVDEFHALNERREARP